MISTQDVSKYDYLRDRPFLVIDTFIVPPAGWPTERKGWRKNHTYAEKPRVVHRISEATMRTALVIIDLNNERVIKNRLKSNATMFDDEVLAHYKEKHADAFRTAVWAQS